MKTSRPIFMAVIALVTIIVLAEAVAQAQTYSVVYSFGKDADGVGPTGRLLIDSKGTLYGTTPWGGKYSGGTIFRIDSDGNEVILYDFDGEMTGPFGGVIGDTSGDLYGVTAWSYGGSCCGGVYKLNLASGTLTVMHTFSGGADGSLPYSRLARDSEGNFYGTTGRGGSSIDCRGNGCGTLFQIDSAGAFTVLHTFTSAEGFLAASLLPDTRGNFYGVLSGGSSKLGSLFRFNPVADKLIMLYRFDGASGSVSALEDVVHDNSGNLYGVTNVGGVFGRGTVYRFNPSTRTETVLHSFAGGSDGIYPNSLIRDAAGNLYGTTIAGGDAYDGIVFVLDPAGNFSILHTFTGSDGRMPNSLILDKENNLFGTTQAGGTHDSGVLFKLALP